MPRFTYPSFRAARIAWLLAIACALGLASTCASAQYRIPQPHLTAQQKADEAVIRSFPLNMDVIRRYAAAIEASNRKHLPCTNAVNSGANNIDATVREMVAYNPRVVPFLAHYGFTPRQFVVTMLALINTVVAAEVLSHPGSLIARAFEQQHPEYNPQNVAFYNAHRAEITALTKKMQSGDQCGD